MNVDRIANEIVQGLPESFRASLQEWDLVKERIRQVIMKELAENPIKWLPPDVVVNVRPSYPSPGEAAVRVAHAAATAAGLPTAYVADQAKFDRVTSDAGKNIRLKDTP